jgi:hypothetical protein
LPTARRASGSVSTSTWLKAIDASFGGAHPRYPHIPAALHFALAKMSEHPHPRMFLVEEQVLPWERE